jgi:hypothetical protein
MSALASIGMSVPGSAGGNFGGLIGDLRNQAEQESDEERRRRLEAERQARLMGGTGSAALSSIFGGNTAAGSIGGMNLGKFGL